MKKIIMLTIGTVFCSSVFAQIYMAKECQISFFSKTSMEDIYGVNKITKPLLNTMTGDIQMRIVLTQFIFDSPLMQEHFNENYVESEKFPTCEFKGKINEEVDYTKDGVTKVTVTGKLKLHGVEKEKTIPGTITVKGKEVIISAKFMMHIADYDIKVPSLYVTTIAEDMETKIDATLEPYKKN